MCWGWRLVGWRHVPTRPLLPACAARCSGKVTVKGARNSANVLLANVPAGKSVVHVIDTVLLPAAKKP